MKLPYELLCLIILLLGWTLIRRSRSATSKIQLDDLLLGEDGKMSRAAVVLLGSFVFTTWLMTMLCLTSRMTEGYFMAYLGAWVAPTVTKLIVNRPATSTTTVTATTVSPT